jgi:3-hydroxybutyrate dehydrogenase
MSAAQKDLVDDVAIVTGGGAGVGQGLAVELARRGARVVITDIDGTAGEQAAEAIRRDGGEASFVRADVRSSEDLAHVLAETRSAYGDVSIVVANTMAGRGGGAIWDYEPDDARQIFDVLVFGVFNTVHSFSQALIETARKGRPARLLVVGSEHTLGVPPYGIPASAYTIAKYTALGVVDTARRDFAGTGVTATVLTPSWVRTEKVIGFVRSSPELAAAIEPYAQNVDVVASIGIDGMLRGDYITATNPSMREFAIAHARDVMIAVQALPAAPVDDTHAHHVHDGSGDAAACPVVGHF